MNFVAVTSSAGLAAHKPMCDDEWMSTPKPQGPDPLTGCVLPDDSTD